MKAGLPEDRSGHAGKRLLNVAAMAFGHRKLLRDPIAGMIHLAIFWGFVILLTAVIETIGEGLVDGFSLSFLGPLHYPLAIAQESIGIAVVIASLLALVRRTVKPPPRLEVAGHEIGVEMNRSANEPLTTEEESEIILVRIDNDGQIYIRNRQTDIRLVHANIESSLASMPDATVVVAAARNSDAGLLVKVVDQARVAGAQQVSMVALSDM